jgi:hypothetical protein
MEPMQRLPSKTAVAAAAKLSGETVGKDLSRRTCRGRRPLVVEPEFCPDAAGVLPDNDVVYLDAKRPLRPSEPFSRPSWTP